MSRAQLLNLMKFLGKINMGPLSSGYIKKYDDGAVKVDGDSP